MPNSNEIKLKDSNFCFKLKEITAIQINYSKLHLSEKANRRVIYIMRNDGNLTS